MSKAACPYCKEDFEPRDHHESGEYECPLCGESMWLEVDVTVSYDAACLESRHKWVDFDDPYRQHSPVQTCEVCGGFRVKPVEGNSTGSNEQ